MTRWIDNSIADRLYILDHVSSLKDITPESVEKDWWVTAVLQCVFELTAAPYMYFKGGTSLSKGWRLIDRFSEDIDIALYRDFFLNELHRSCAACETNNQIMNLRKVSRDYVTTVLKAELEERLKANGLTGTSIEAVTTRQTSEGEKPIDHDSDPTVLNVHYKSILSPADKYIRPVVKIEISCLSLGQDCIQIIIFGHILLFPIVTHMFQNGTCAVLSQFSTIIYCLSVWLWLGVLYQTGQLSAPASARRFLLPAALPV